MGKTHVNVQRIHSAQKSEGLKTIRIDRCNPKNDPIFNFGIALIVDFPSIDVQVPSLSDLWRSIWILTSRGKERFVNEIHRHKPGIVGDTSLWRTKEENLENVSFESVKPASGNRGYGSEDLDTAKSNDKPSNELRKKCNIHDICYIFEKLQF